MTWIQFVEKHHSIEILTADTIRIPDIGYDKSGKYVDHVITKKDNLYEIQEYDSETGRLLGVWTEQSIKAYLGY